MTMPTFIGLGAAKAGTTSIREYLCAHPQVYVVEGEPRFFSSEGLQIERRNTVHRTTVTTIENYRDLFGKVKNEIAIGDISPSYLHTPGTAENIKRYIPEAKLFAVFRNPVDRAYSHFLHMIKSGLEPATDFPRALEEDRVDMKGWVQIRYYKEMGFYHEQLSRYFRVFDRDQIKVYLYEDLKEDSAAVMRDLYRFLGVDPEFRPDLSVQYNPSGIPKSRFLQSVLSKPHPVKTFVKSALSPKLYGQLIKFRLAIHKHNLRRVGFPAEAREPLIRLYREDILHLQDLIDRDLSAWLR